MAEESQIREGDAEKGGETIEGLEEGEILGESDETTSLMENPLRV
jgi:hypothetical protein